MTSIRRYIEIVESAGLDMSDAARLNRARQMGFDTSTVVYHGTRANEFDAFDSGKLGAYTGTDSAKLGFFFGTSRENSVTYAGADPLLPGIKDVPALTEIIKAIKAACAAEGLPSAFTMGVSSGSAIPLSSTLTDKTDDVERIRSALAAESTRRFQNSLQRAEEYKRAYAAGAYKPKRDYTTPTFVDKQVALLTRQHEIAQRIIADWKEPMKATDWGRIDAFFLRMRNPLTVDQANGRRGETFAEIISRARAAGHDGVIILNTFDPKPTDVHVVFAPEQIRSVNARFDPAKADSPNVMD